MATVTGFGPIRVAILATVGVSGRFAPSAPRAEINGH